MIGVPPSSTGLTHVTFTEPSVWRSALTRVASPGVVGTRTSTVEDPPTEEPIELTATTVNFTFLSGGKVFVNVQTLLPLTVAGDAHS